MKWLFLVLLLLLVLFLGLGKHVLFPVNQVSTTGQHESGSDHVVLAQNSPNPFTDSTRICYYLPDQETVELFVLTEGESILDTLISELQAPGWHEVTYHAGDLSYGTYLYRLDLGEEILERNMLMVPEYGTAAWRQFWKERGQLFDTDTL